MKKRLLAIIATAAMVVTMIPSMVFAAPADTDVAAIGETGYSTLQEAIDAIATTPGNHEIKVLKDLSEDVTVSQNEGVNVTINGNEKAYSGTINVNGNSRYSDETLDIINFNFVTEEASHDFVWSNSQNAPGRYAHNVTVENCTFEATGAAVNSAVGMRFRQARNISAVDCTATGLHSFMQATGGIGITVDNLTAEDCKNGISTGTADNVVIKNSKIEAVGEKGYGIRPDASSNFSFTIENTTVDAYIPVAIRNATTEEEYKLALKGENVFNASNKDGVEIGVSKTSEESEFVDVEETDANVSAVTVVDPVPEPTPAKPDNSPNTGDNSMAPFAVAGLVMAAMAAVVATRRRTN